ncbi:MAG: ABC transporter substrate-binding protein [Candidatus Rokubacteria bacterium]|nr:ABC transporter substrate-binding protein [Candidatus Rokubacteria bacterium]
MARKLDTAAPSRRDFLKTAGLFGGMAAAGWPALGHGQGLKTITASHSVSTFVYGQHLVAAQKKFFEEEGLKTPDFIVPGGGAKVVQALAAGQVLFALGDSNHPLKITEKGKDALMIFATDTRCSYANIVVRKELFDKGVKSVEALADQKLVGRKAVIAATAIGSGTYVYGVYVLKNTKAADGKPVNDSVEWVGGGGDLTILGGLKAGKFDAIMAVPEWQSKAVGQGFGQPIYDVQDEKSWNRVFGGPIPVTVGYVLKETIEKSPDLVQGYVNACYRAQQWIRKAKDDEVVDLLQKPYLSTYTREDILESVRYYRTIFDWDFIIEEKDYERGMKVWVPLAVEKPIPFKQAVDMSFVKKAQAKYK